MGDDKSWEARHKKSVIVMGEDEEKELIKCEPLTDVAHVQVYPPVGRRDDCLIYGKISFNVGTSGDPVTLFDRESDNPVFMKYTFWEGLEDESDLGFLPLSDSPRPLEAVSNSNPIRVTMKLYAKKISGEDEPIADVKDFQYGRDAAGMCKYFTLPETEPGSCFRFRVFYAVIRGPRVEVEVRIKEEEGKSPVIPINAKIAALQNLNICHPDCYCSKINVTLFDRSQLVSVGDKLQLERSLFGFPMEPPQFFTIAIAIGTEEHLVDFALKRLSGGSFMTNKQLTHTKDVPGTPFSVSIKFLHRPAPN